MALSQEENEKLTRVGPGTPMGDLLRRYWHPIAAVGELDEASLKRVRLLGEDLVLYRDGSGTYGLIEAFCAHRLTDLAFGIVEDYGIRCPHQGWLYNEAGRCLDMPLEPEPFLEDIRLKAYSVAVKAGLIWAYLGPEPAPLVPDFEPFTWEDGLIQIVFADLPCNWLQCQENSLDPMEIEWFQASLGKQEFGPPPPPLGVENMDFEEFEYGFVYQRRRPGSGDDAWAVGRACIWPNGLFSGDARSCHFDWKVPVDDTHTVNVSWFIDRVAPGASLPEKRVFYWYANLKEQFEDVYPSEEEGKEPLVVKREEWITTHQMNRNFVIWLNQDPIVDRTKEHLTETDRGVVMLRDKLFAQIDLIADGGEPKAVIRDPEANRRLLVPFSVKLQDGGDGSPAAEPEDFPYLAGQPEEVAEAYRAVKRSWRQQG